MERFLYFIEKNYQPVTTPNVKIRTSMLGEKVDKNKPIAANTEPEIVTNRHPYLLAKTLATGPERRR